MTLHRSEVKRIAVPGSCRVCGCTEECACILGDGLACWWIDELHTLCSAPRCLAVIPLAELEREFVQTGTADLPGEGIRRSEEAI
jgi:hypothetical protein